MNIIKRKINTVLKNPKSVLQKALYLSSPIFNDNIYLKLLFPLKTSYRLNLNNPKTYNEKLQWLKINYRQPIMTRIVDKYEVKEFARNIIGREHIIETYGVWNSFEEIDFDKLPKQFVLKTTHDQGGVIVVKNKEDLNKKAVRKKIEKHLNFKHYYLTREWCYKDVKPRIMAEALLANDIVGDLYDYKFLCFHGELKVMYIAHGRNTGDCRFDFFDMDFNKVNVESLIYPKSEILFNQPQNWELMKELASKLSKGWPHVRVDFYSVNGKVYLGELTFYTHGGMFPFNSQHWDRTFGDWIDLESVKKEIKWKSRNESR